MKKQIFKTKINDEEHELCVKKPSYLINEKADMMRSKKFRELIQNGCLLKVEVDKVAKERGVWSETTEKEIVQLNKQIDELRNKLQKGGIRLVEGEKISLEIMKIRNQILSLNGEKNSLDNNTAEALADNYRFDFMVSECSFYNDSGKRVFETFDDYLLNKDESHAYDCANNFAKLVYNITDGLIDVLSDMPEYKFMVKYKFMDEKLRRINKKGQLVDDEGRLINENNRYINEKNELVDIDGNRMDENGNYIDEPSFLDA